MLGTLVTGLLTHGLELTTHIFSGALHCFSCENSRLLVKVRQPRQRSAMASTSTLPLHPLLPSEVASKPSKSKEVVVSGPLAAVFEGVLVVLGIAASPLLLIPLLAVACLSAYKSSVELARTTLGLW
jgi:hypothetical protein